MNAVVDHFPLALDGIFSFVYRSYYFDTSIEPVQCAFPVTSRQLISDPRFLPL